MVIFEIETKEAKEVFLEIKKLISVSKTWKLTSSIEITVRDGKTQLVGQGFAKEGCIDYLFVQACGQCAFLV